MGAEKLKWGFDFDGVLCEPVPPMPDAWRIPKSRRTPEIENARNAHYLNHFKNAKPLLAIPGLHHKPCIITARRDTALCRQTSTEWLNRYSIEVDNLVMHKGSQHFEAVASYKAKAIKTLGISCYVDDKIDLCRRIKEKLPYVSVFHFRGTEGFMLSDSPFIVTLDVAMKITSSL